MIINPVAMW